MNAEKLENFIRAFSTHCGGIVRDCNCGVIYFEDSDNAGTWEDDELEKLRTNPNARGVDHSIGTISFEGKECVEICDCWHPRAKKIMQFIDEHNIEIAEYLTLEKKRKEWIAKNSPVVK